MNKKVFFIYRFLTIASLSTGIILNLVNTTKPEILMCYYTMQSNVLCLFAFLFFTLKKSRNRPIYHIGKGAITIAILLTAVVYLVALLPNDFPMYTVSDGITGKAIGNLLVHVISPILVMLDYFIWEKKGNFKWYYPWLWLLLPCMYVCFVYWLHAKGRHFYGIGGSRDFAYFFLDYSKIGMAKVACWMVVITVLILIMGYVLVIIDKILAKKN